MQVRQINADGTANTYQVIEQVEEGVQVILIQDISMTEKEIESFQKFVAYKGWTAYGMEGYITEKKQRRGGVMTLVRK